MSKTRLEAFSDGVIAILITIMILELKIPEETDFHALRPLLPIFLTYVLSFVLLGIYWNNHHHMLQAAERINETAVTQPALFAVEYALARLRMSWGVKPQQPAPRGRAAAPTPRPT